ncbi:hypothetical protein QVD17_38939 [Tagetes erecta]|uniref:Transmembrane protein n=1 Tax=Tagetes erecta TaxID=13708 RepID=A0AAD8N9S7_TARER|nr:hypothetical protein QVD17_38939 [Tagetes erecta]
MAEEEEQQQLKYDIFHPNTLISWERIQLPSLPTQFQSQSSVIVLSDPNSGDGTWSTPPTSVVFPPNNHEGLNLNHQFNVLDTHDEKLEQTKSLQSVSSEVKPVVIGRHVPVKWWWFLQFKLSDIVSCIWDLTMVKRGLLWCFKFPLIGSTVVLLLVYLSCRRRRRRLRGETVDGLLGVIKEKDERIHHLLQQIARLNEILLVSHHGVPMISKGSST